MLLRILLRRLLLSGITRMEIAAFRAGVCTAKGSVPRPMTAWGIVVSVGNGVPLARLDRSTVGRLLHRHASIVGRSCRRRFKRRYLWLRVPFLEYGHGRDIDGYGRKRKFRVGLYLKHGGHSVFSRFSISQFVIFLADTKMKWGLCVALWMSSNSCR